MNRPPITPEMRARARTTPNAWLHVVDPNHRVSTAIPPAESVIGRYLVDGRGEITDQYVPNPRYRPIPTPPPLAHRATRPPAAAAGQPAPTRPAAPPAAAPPPAAAARPAAPTPAAPTPAVPAGSRAPTGNAVAGSPGHAAPAPGAVAAGPPPPAHLAASSGVVAGNPSAHVAPSPSPASSGAAQPSATAPRATDRPAADVEPANELEAVLRLAHQGELDRDDLLAAVLAADLVLPADPARPPRGHLVTRGPVVDAFASPKALPGDWPPRWHRFTGVELAVLFDRLGEPLWLNLGDSSGRSWEITSDALVAALRGAVGVG
ncbi:hypothetical protein LZG04_08510 [Saccharothrix sp. S26]|uniref:hypothetical protein n=1 Tax=Saccharothrix sp. S26 TaxID=2907215 RepID=UPI001F347A36|nr:hypothetical protein [Saccharothrix sp. S26]MCE6994844.1 hypothetical protein [Saccharothrix sp. S26]